MALTDRLPRLHPCETHLNSVWGDALISSPLHSGWPANIQTARLNFRSCTWQRDLSKSKTNDQSSLPQEKKSIRPHSQSVQYARKQFDVSLGGSRPVYHDVELTSGASSNTKYYNAGHALTPYGSMSPLRIKTSKSSAKERPHESWSRLAPLTQTNTTENGDYRMLDAVNNLHEALYLVHQPQETPDTTQIRGQLVEMNDISCSYAVTPDLMCSSADLNVKAMSETVTEVEIPGQMDKNSSLDSSEFAYYQTTPHFGTSPSSPATSIALSEIEAMDQLGKCPLEFDTSTVIWAEEDAVRTHGSLAPTSLLLSRSSLYKRRGNKISDLHKLQTTNFSNDIHLDSPLLSAVSESRNKSSPPLGVTGIMRKPSPPHISSKMHGYTSSCDSQNTTFPDANMLLTTIKVHQDHGDRFEMSTNLPFVAEDMFDQYFEIANSNYSVGDNTRYLSGFRTTELGSLHCSVLAPAGSRRVEKGRQSHNVFVPKIVKARAHREASTSKGFYEEVRDDYRDLSRDRFVAKLEEQLARSNRNLRWLPTLRGSRFFSKNKDVIGSGGSGPVRSKRVPHRPFVTFAPDYEGTWV